MPDPDRPSVLDPRCGAQQALDLIANKWTALVIRVLARGTRRFGELQREIGGVSQKMLTQTLRKLERDGIVARTVHPVVPPKVEYALTPLGATLIEPLGALCRWAERHLDALLAARARHDGATAQDGRGSRDAGAGPKRNRSRRASSSTIR
jgi:DNA-binding HxlR family transcriptional regulator